MKLLSFKDFKALIGAGESTLRLKIARGEVPPPFRIGRKLFWSESAILTWLKEKEGEGGEK